MAGPESAVVNCLHVPMPAFALGLDGAEAGAARAASLAAVRPRLTRGSGAEGRPLPILLLPRFLLRLLLLLRVLGAGCLVGGAALLLASVGGCGRASRGGWWGEACLGPLVGPLVAVRVVRLPGPWRGLSGARGTAGLAGGGCTWVGVHICTRQRLRYGRGGGPAVALVQARPHWGVGEGRDLEYCGGGRRSAG
jgi:hypothetical protein